MSFRLYAHGASRRELEQWGYVFGSAEWYRDRSALTRIFTSMDDPELCLMRGSRQSISDRYSPNPDRRSGYGYHYWLAYRLGRRAGGMAIAHGAWVGGAAKYSVPMTMPQVLRCIKEQFTRGAREAGGGDKVILVDHCRESFIAAIADDYSTARSLIDLQREHDKIKAGMEGAA